MEPERSDLIDARELPRTISLPTRPVAPITAVVIVSPFTKARSVRKRQYLVCVCARAREVLSAGTSRRGDNAFRVQTVLCVYAGRDRLMLTSARI